VPDEVHGHRDTGSEERRDTPRRRVLAAVPGCVREHAGRDRRRKSDRDQEGDGIGRGHNGHDTSEALAGLNGAAPDSNRPSRRTRVVRMRPPATEFQDSLHQSVRLTDVRSLWIGDDRADDERGGTLRG